MQGFDKFQDSFMILKKKQKQKQKKTSFQTENREKIHLRLIKGIYKKDRAKLYLMVKHWTLPLNTWNNSRMSSFRFTPNILTPV